MTGALVAKRLGEHGLDLIVIGFERLALEGMGIELVKHRLDLVASLRRHAGHRRAKLLNLARPQQLEHLCRLVGAQRHQQQGALLHSVIAAHCFPSIP